jgi:hypothetical protein
VGNGSAECDGGVIANRGNAELVLSNNLIYGNGRNGLTFLDATGGPHYVLNNTIVNNGWNGVRVARGHGVTVLLNNLITHNGAAPGATGGRYGIVRENTTKPDPRGILLLHNLVCGNRTGELNGPMLDTTDLHNQTPSGREGLGVEARAGCEQGSLLFANRNGADGQPNTRDDEFRLATTAPAIDRGRDSRTVSLPVANALLEADYNSEGVRPVDGDQNGVAEFDIGALEQPGQQCEPRSEVCNGRDDDCNGQVDEGLGELACGIGACRRTTNVCVNGALQTCTPGTPTTEICNNLDDDCDGQTDEGLGQTTCGIGACQRTVNSCAGGSPQVCTPGQPIAEICANQRDDDCDGQVDELDACPTNQPPRITSVPVITAAEGQGYGYDVNATDPDAGDTLTFSLTVAPFGMTIDPTTGVIHWTPEQVQAGAQAVTVQVRDEGGLFSRQSFMVQVVEANRAPTAVDDSYEAEIGQTLTVPAPGILTNDTDPNQGNTLSALLVSPPSNGTLNLNADGSFAYTPRTSREPTPVQGNLTQLVPATTASASSSFNGFPPSRVIDDNLSTDWFTAAGDAVNRGTTPFLEIVFPQDVTVTELQMFGSRAFPNGFDFFAGIFKLFDASGAVLFDSGVVNLPAPDRDVTLPIPNIAGVRRVRFTATADEGPDPGFAELKVIGSTVVPAPLQPVLKWKWTGSTVEPTFNQVIVTPTMANLTDDNQDGRIDQQDIPDILFVTTSSLSAAPCSDGILRAIRGSDGASVFDVTDLALRVAICAPPAIGDLDGDGAPEIVAVQTSGSRVIVLNRDGTLRQRFAATPSVDFGLGGSPSIADLDGDGAPEIIVGAKVFDRNGALLSTASGSGNVGFGAISTAADLDLDGTLEVVTGFKAVRRDGSLVFENRADGGYPAIGNFDNDPFPEIVVVSSSNVFLLEHDGTLKWGPKPIPGGGRGGPPTVADFDSDGQPEIGVAGSTRYAVFETNGDLKWQATIRDGSNITGSSVFDFDNDGRSRPSVPVT